MTIEHKKKPDSKAKIDHILHPIVKEWFYSKFKNYAEPQRYAVMEIHSRTNILVSAPTGCGKTLTAFLSILNELVDAADKGILKDHIYATYISPLKALNEDIKVNLMQPLEEIKKIAREKYNKDIDIRVAVRGGDTTTKEKAQMLKNPPHIFITTPESLSIAMASPKFKEVMKQMQWFIIDEIHSIAESKRGTHLILSLERLEKHCGHLTRVGLSATVSPLEEVAKYLVGTNRSCKIINVQFIKELDLEVMSPVDDLVNITYKDLHKKTYDLMHKLIQEHKTTLIFTNTRAATERVVHHLRLMFPKYYGENIGAHHGSLSKEIRHDIESRLRAGTVKCVVCSTSLELGIDIGFIDLVICMGSPKTVARTLQRIGRSGHSLDAVTKGRIIVMDRDDLVECSVLLKNAIEKRIDRIHVPTNALDVLSQQMLGAAIEDVWDEEELYQNIISSYPYRDLSRTDYFSLLSYLAGEFSELEDRHVYAKIWRKDGAIGKRGKLTRVLYMTNIGTIPSQSGVLVKLGTQTIGSIDESFLERLRKRDIFVLGGSTYEFRYAKGMVAHVVTSIGNPPTVPSWASEMLPLSFDLANDIATFRGLIENKCKSNESKSDIIVFIHKYLYVNKKAAEAMYLYIKEQYQYAVVPHSKRIVIEHYKDERGKKIVFHTLYGRRVNDCLSRAVAYIISKYEKTDVEMGISDNGFYIATSKNVSIPDVVKTITTSDLYEIMDLALDKTEVLKRRFRHCAERSLMILRNYMGKTKRVGKQQTMSSILINAVNEISHQFPILKEARREVLEDVMDIENAKIVVENIKDKKIQIQEIHTSIPSPFAFQLVLQGFTDILKIDDKLEFLKRMHEMVLAKIALHDKKGDFEFTLPAISKPKEDFEEFLDYIQHIKKYGAKEQKKLAQDVYDLPEEVTLEVKFDLARVVYGQKPKADLFKDIRKQEEIVARKWPKKLASFIISKAHENFSYTDAWEEAKEDDSANNQSGQAESEDELYKKMLMEQFQKVHKMIDLDPLIYFELEKFIENPKNIYDKKFKKWINDLIKPPVPPIWPKELMRYIQEYAHLVK